MIDSVVKMWVTKDLTVIGDSCLFELIDDESDITCEDKVAITFLIVVAVIRSTTLNENEGLVRAIEDFWDA